MIKAGANKLLRDINGLTARAIAVRLKRSDILEALLSPSEIRCRKEGFYYGKGGKRIYYKKE